ncbi:MAG: ECF-family polymerase sigma factor [Polyangiaceae bacterium]|nr:ECF-family polymerase sigma factor [Polyangiaceae bacterium]
MAVLTGGRARLVDPQMAIDSARLTRVAQEHLDFVWRCLRRFGVPAADADDAAQQVFLVAADKLADVPVERERAFLFATAARIAANARRSIRRRQSAYDNLSQAPEEPRVSQDELSDQLRARALLDQVMADMPEDLREVFVLFEIEEISIQDIATALDIPIGTVGSRLRRARQAFQQAVIRHRARMGFRQGAVG